jgi:hypothetical protein
MPLFVALVKTGSNGNSPFRNSLDVKSYCHSGRTEDSLDLKPTLAEYTILINQLCADSASIPGFSSQSNTTRRARRASLGLLSTAEIVESRIGRNQRLLLFWR